MKKVMHLMSTHSFSGAENVACQIIKIFEKQEGYNMIYVSEINENKEVLDSRNIKYYKLDKFNFWNVKKAVDKIKPDIIHAHDIKASIMASFFANRAQIISHVHANHENMRKLNMKTFLYNMRCSKYKKIIWIANSALENYHYKDKIINKSKVIYNIVSEKELLKKLEEDPNDYNYDIVYLGRLSYAKNPLRIVEIISHVKEIDENVKVAMIGDGELYKEVEEQISIKGLKENIDLYGFMLNPYKILSNSKVMLMTSRYEGTPMCALEAMNLGVPIVSTPTDGLVDLIIDGKNGYLSDDDQVLVSKIANIITNTEIQKELSENSKEMARKINDIEQYRNKLIEIYN